MYEPEHDDRSLTLDAEEPIEQQLDVNDEEAMAPYPSNTPDSDVMVEREVDAGRQTESEQNDEVAEDHETRQPPPSSPKTPILHHQIPIRHHHNHLTVTTTTTIPMHFTPVAYKPSLEDAENIPPATADVPTFDRAAALAAIEYRRGRAKSIASGQMTPRKQMLEGVKERRDISAPALGGKTVGGLSFAKGASSVGRAGGRRMG